MFLLGAGVANARRDGRHDCRKFRRLIKLTQNTMARRRIGQVNHSPSTDFDFMSVVFPDRACVVPVRAEVLRLHRRMENGCEKLAISLVRGGNSGTISKLKQIDLVQAKATRQCGRSFFKGKSYLDDFGLSFRNVFWLKYFNTEPLASYTHNLLRF